MSIGPLVSVGVAVYNVEKFLPQCINSLVNQTYENLEIILVDDGSTDSSPKICDYYAKSDPRIKVIHKPNRGLWSARQIALDNSSGVYFCVCDGDDWLEPEMYHELVRQIEIDDSDICICNYYRNYDNGDELPIVAESLPREQSIIIKDVLIGDYPSMVWNKLFKKSIFVNNEIKWEEGVNLGEDLLIFLKILKTPVRIDYTSKVLYHYRRFYNSPSYTNQLSLNSFKQYGKVVSWIVDNYDSSSYGKGIAHQKVNLAFSALRVTDFIGSEYQESILKLSIRDFFKYKLFSCKDLIVLCSLFLGYSIVSHFVKKYYHLYYI